MKVGVIEQDTEDRWSMRYVKCSKVQDVFRDDFSICGACVEHNLVLVKSQRPAYDACVFDMYKIETTDDGVLEFEKEPQIRGPVVMVYTDERGEPIDIPEHFVLLEL